MPQSLSQVWLHIVFSTKERQPFLHDSKFRDEMFRMLGHSLGEIGCFPKISGGWIDHVHVLCGLSRTLSIAQLVEHIKTETSRWAKKQSRNTKVFGWQNGYGAFSVSHSNLDRVVRYISNQEQHHKRWSFQHEFRELCRKHNVEIDERYVWD